MKSLHNETNWDSPEAYANEVMETISKGHHFIRKEMRSNRLEGLTIPQFRSLGFLRRNPGTSLSDLADFLGLALPSASKLVDGLVRRSLVERENDPIDRRRITLIPTDKGNQAMEITQKATLDRFGKLLDSLSEEDSRILIQGIRVMKRLLDSEHFHAKQDSEETDVNT